MKSNYYYNHIEVPKDLDHYQEHLEKNLSEMTIWKDVPVALHIEHIVSHYHNRIRSILPELITLAQKVESDSKNHTECPVGLAASLEDMHRDLTAHMEKEEMILFPLIKNRVANDPLLSKKVLDETHDSSGKNFSYMKVLTFNFRPPADATPVWILLYKELKQFEQILIEHLIMEKEILFPRAFEKA